MSAPASRERRRGGRHEPARSKAGELSTVFPSVAPSAASARRFVDAALHRRGFREEFIERVLLLTSELVTNAYRHARSESRLSIRCDDDRVRIEVRDAGHGGVKLRPLDPSRPDGRGLHIVDALADRWGHRSEQGGTVVWFELVQPA